MAVIDTIVLGLAVTLFAGWCFQWYIHLIAIIYGKWRLHKKNNISDEKLPGVSIIKPLTGVDPHLYSNLETFFTMDYPEYELLFCLEVDSDPALMVVRSLQEKYPKVSTQVFTGAKKIGVNPKINNMLPGYEAASHDFLLISDSGLRMKSDTLKDMMSSMADNVGLVHQMPFVCDKHGFAGVLEKVYFGTVQAKMYLNAEFAGMTCVTGMSCLFRRYVLDEAGGLRAFTQYIAEDFHLALAFRDRGWKVRISSQPAWQNAGNHSVSNFQARMKRWVKLRTSLLPVTALLEPVSECLALGVVGSWAVSVVFTWSPLAFFFVHVLIWFLLDYTLLHIVQNGPIPFSKFECVVAWLFREGTTLYTMLKAHSEPHITWRTKKYFVKWGGIGEEVRTRQFV